MLGVDAVLSGIDVRLAYNFSPFSDGVVMQCVGYQFEFRVLQLHIVVKRGLACISMIFTPVRCQVVFAVNQFAAFKVISHIIHAVVVEAVRAHYLFAVRHDHVFAHLGHLGTAVVVQFVTFKCEGVALHDAYPSESVKRL